MGKCAKCGSYDVDVSTDLKYTLECQDCGAKWNLRKKRAKKVVEKTCKGCHRTEYVVGALSREGYCDACEEEIRILATDFVRYEIRGSGAVRMV